VLVVKQELRPQYYRYRRHQIGNNGNKNNDNDNDNAACNGTETYLGDRKFTVSRTEER